MITIAHPEKSSGELKMRNNISRRNLLKFLPSKLSINDAFCNMINFKFYNRGVLSICGNHQHSMYIETASMES